VGTSEVWEWHTHAFVCQVQYYRNLLNPNGRVRRQALALGDALESDVAQALLDGSDGDHDDDGDDADEGNSAEHTQTESGGDEDGDGGDERGGGLPGSPDPDATPVASPWLGGIYNGDASPVADDGASLVDGDAAEVAEGGRGSRRPATAPEVNPWMRTLGVRNSLEWKGSRWMWKTFVITYKPPTSMSSTEYWPSSSFQASCPYHRKSRVTGCKKTLTIPVPGDQDEAACVDDTLRRLKFWCSHYSVVTTQLEHKSCNIDAWGVPPDVFLDREEMPTPSDDVVPDDELSEGGDDGDLPPDLPPPPLPPPSPSRPAKRRGGGGRGRGRGRPAKRAAVGASSSGGPGPDPVIEDASDAASANAEGSSSSSSSDSDSSSSDSSSSAA
jgi:hypothetical protein